MLFNSFEFLVFFVVVTSLFFALPHRFRWLHLLIASCVFYMAFLPVYLLILVVTIVVDYYAGLWIAQSAGKKRKYFLVGSLVANIGFLCFFKYYDFFVENINDAFSISIPLLKELWLSTQVIQINNFINSHLNSWVGTELDILQTIVLPIGLSFHTFQAMSYTIEVYRGNQEPERHFGIYALYVMFYPQLVAGPIERPQNVLHQFHERKYFNQENLIIGLRLMAWGLFKKVVIADRLSQYVNAVYAIPLEYHWLNLAIATVFFAIQIYCDFSGYSDMAIGAARVMGYHLMINFRRPYFATNIQDFWARWHISLSTWFRDYLYIPLGGNRVRFYRFLLNVFVVFVISGFWHGAAWTFVIWGFLHAVFIVCFNVWNKYAKEKGLNRNTPFWNMTGWLLTMTCVCFAWVFFRANGIQNAWDVLRSMMSFASPVPFRMAVGDINVIGQGFGIFSLLVILVSLTFMLYIEKRHQPLLLEFSGRFWKDVSFLSFTVFLIISFGVFVEQSFIYFQF